MPQRSKGPRLRLRKHKGKAVGWYIRDGQHEERTGCGPDDLRGAEAALARYVATKHAKQAREARNVALDAAAVADVLISYWEAQESRVARPTELRTRLRYLNEFWGSYSVDDVTPDRCREYAAQRSSPAAARRELEDMRAAIKYAWNSRKIASVVPVWLPERSESRERWLTRSEMARLLLACWRYREIQKGAPGRYTRRHVARFILMARYTGSRAGAICAASLWPEPGRGWVDLTNGLYYRASELEKPTKKRKPTIRLPDPLVAHIRSWVARAERDYAAGRRKHPMRHVVEWNGKPVNSIRKAFAGARDDAKLGKEVTPHVLRHTAVTWAMQNGADKWEVSGFFGVSPETVERVYGHHSPSHQETVHRAITSRKLGKSLGK